MKTLRKSVVCFVALSCLLVFGAWTPANAEIRYGDAEILSTYASETVTYTNRVPTPYNSTVNGAPEYVQIGGLTNCCGAVSGSILVGFYDRYFPNLIPGWDPTYPTGAYRRQDTVNVPALMNDLYTRMRTNVDDVGVSEQDFLNGLSSYVTSKGYSLTYQRVATSTTLDYAACKSAIDSNNLVVIFSNPGNLYSISVNEGEDWIYAYNISDYHIMIAYGYQEIAYYNANGLFRTDRYLGVKTAKPGVSSALYKISPHNLESAYAVTIS